MPLKQSEQTSPKPSLLDAVSYRIPLTIREVLVLQSGDEYCICPRCDKLLNREYMHFCDHCGQKLDWHFLDHAKIVLAPRKK